MHRRLRSFELRLARLAARVRDWAAEVEENREAHEARKAVAALIRAGLERAGLDPAQAPSLRRLERLAPPPAPRAPWRRLDPADAFLAKVRALAERLRGHPPPLATASPAQLLAYYCFGEGAPG